MLTESGLGPHLERLVAQHARLSAYLALPESERTWENAPTIRAEDTLALLEVVIAVVRRIS